MRQQGNTAYEKLAMLRRYAQQVCNLVADGKQNLLFRTRIDGGAKLSDVDVLPSFFASLSQSEIIQA